jgi:hypothetical protein
MGMTKLVLARAATEPQAFPPMQLALFYGEAGDLDKAFEFLDRAIEGHDRSHAVASRLCS